ncbi:MAG: hypothetical protein ACXQS8_02775 [Candidatus Helarchaeales archaeon]
MGISNQHPSNNPLGFTSAHLSHVAGCAMPTSDRMNAVKIPK